MQGAGLSDPVIN